MTDRHVRWRDLADRRDGRLSPSKAARVEAHLASGCGVCALEARRLDRVVTAIREGAPAEPPSAAEREAIRLFRETNLAFAKELERVVGVLVADHADRQLAASLRAATGDTRQLVWRVASYSVDASVVAGAKGADVLGQIVPDGDDPEAVVSGVVTASTDRRVRGRSTIAPDGRFTFRGLRRGLYTIEGRVDATAFVLPPLNLE